MVENPEQAPGSVFDWRRLMGYGVALVLCSSLFTAYQMVLRPRFQLTFQISASNAAPSSIKLRYNSGSGFKDADTRADTFDSRSLTSFRVVRFELPRRKDIVGLQLEPLLYGHSITLRNIAIRGRYGVVATVPISDVLPLSEVKDRAENEDHDQVTFTTTSSAQHPQLTIRLATPLAYKRLLALDRTMPILVGNVILIGILLFLFMRVDVTQRWSISIRSHLKAARDRARPISRRSVPVIACFVACSLAVTLYQLARVRQFQLSLDISSSVSSAAQVFFDVGNGFTEQFTSVLDIHAGPEFSRLSFDLPDREVLRFRFDPLTTAGTVTLRRIAIEGPHGTSIRIKTADLKPFNQIQARAERGETVTFTTVPGANDPGLIFDVPGGFDPAPLRAAETKKAILLDNALLLIVATVVLLQSNRLLLFWASLRIRGQLANRPIEVLASRLSNPDFIRIDATAVWFYLLCVTAFLVAVLADFNGSSVGMYSRTFGAPEEPIAGAPRPIRADEWAYETPTILNQSFRAQRFAAEHSFLGDHWVALGANVPVRHLSAFFRPQFWAFFLLPTDYAYSAYWQFKAFILVIGIFSLLLLLTRSTLWSIAGSLWYFFSPCTQWTYSWPSALPEMVGSMCLLVVFSCFLTIGANTVPLTLAAFGAASCAITFALCAYLPHQVPILWFGLFVIVSWCVAKRHLIFSRTAFIKRALAISATLVTVALVGFVVFSELRLAIAATANTAYPGMRDLQGGDTAFQLLTSHFLQWTQTETHFPPMFLNICESSGFLWLAPITLLFVHKLSFSKFQKLALVALWCSFVITILWLLLPIPAHVGRLLAFNQTKGTRLIPALGIANICIVALCVSAARKPGDPSHVASWTRLLGRVGGIFPLAYTILLLTNLSLASYFSWREVLFAGSFLTVATAVLFEQRKRALAVLLVVPQAVLFATVNPTQHGIGVFTASPLYNFVHSNRELLNDKWLVYSDSHATSGYLAALGCNVYTGSRYLPDIDHFPEYASAGLSLKDFDRDGMLLARPLPPGTKPSSFVPIGYSVVWNVSPTDPILAKLHIRYFAFDRKPSDEIASQLTPLGNEPISNLWIYKLAPGSQLNTSRVIK